MISAERGHEGYTLSLVSDAASHFMKLVAGCGERWEGRKVGRMRHIDDCRPFLPRILHFVLLESSMAPLQPEHEGKGRYVGRIANRSFLARIQAQYYSWN